MESCLASHSVPADPGCSSRIPDADFYPSWIPALRSRIQNRNKREGWKKFVDIPFCSHNFHKIENYLIFEMLKKKRGQFTQKIVPKLSKIWVWDPGSGKNLFRIQESKRHWIQDPGLWPVKNVFFCKLKGRWKCRGTKSLSIDTIHTPPPLSF